MSQNATQQPIQFTDLEAQGLDPNINAHLSQKQRRNKAVALLIAGVGTVAIAKALNVPEGTVRQWKSRHMTKEQLQELRARWEDKFDEEMLAFLADTIAAQRAMMKVVSDEEYLKRQSAVDVAILFETVNDRSLRLFDAMQRAAAEGIDVPIPASLPPHVDEEEDNAIDAETLT
jgi:hypothetical protein